MRLNRLISLLVLIMLSPHLTAQNAKPDVMLIKGNIIDFSTHEPVKAKIQYESLPYGSKIGIFSGSSFSFNMEEGKDYSLRVSAEGYAPYTTVLKASKLQTNNGNTVIELKPTGINQLIRLDKLIFALGKADISEESHQELDELVAMLNGNENITIQLEGHTDFRGNEKQNMKLSEKRVEAVKDYLVSKGIDKKRIGTKAFGGSHPLSREDDAEARRNNRRVEVRILSN
ncbi:OmpA family protein [Fulvivirga sp. 29W222]|uniref:OmpA family protein n=1 Tax=Fulvivirga marina TaxID=2494733 RepID=A0A937KCF1_9BACT|nr:OmpA family protein [Fulvivirga marina]MBL6447452.1 OmpA family protein [Fulvivirga marina]